MNTPALTVAEPLVPPLLPAHTREVTLAVIGVVVLVVLVCGFRSEVRASKHIMQLRPFPKQGE